MASTGFHSRPDKDSSNRDPFAFPQPTTSEKIARYGRHLKDNLRENASNAYNATWQPRSPKPEPVPEPIHPAQEAAPTGGGLGANGESLSELAGGQAPHRGRHVANPQSDEGGIGAGGESLSRLAGGQAPTGDGIGANGESLSELAGGEKPAKSDPGIGHNGESLSALAGGKAPVAGRSSQTGPGIGANGESLSELAGGQAPTSKPAAPKLAGTKTPASFRHLMRRHPKGVGWGIVAIISAFISVIIFLISVPFQLIHMAQILLEHNFGPGNKIEEKAGRKLIARLFEARAADPATGAMKNTGHPIKDKLANMKIDRFNKTLAQQNIKMNFDSNGRLIDISNTVTGEKITDFSDASFMERRSAVADLVSENIAPWRVLKRLSYTRLMRFHARVSFQFWPKEKVKDIKTLLAEKIKVGASDAEISGAANKDKLPPADNTTVSDGSDAAKAAKTTSDWFQKTKDKVGAIREGSKVFLAKNATTFGITAIVSLICTVQQMVNDAVEKGYLDRVDVLMRAGNMIPTQAAQLYTGKNLDLDSFDQLMQRYNGDPQAPADSVDHQDWSQSAAAKRINDLPVDSNPRTADGKANSNYNPDLSPAANPDSIALKKIVDVMNAILSMVPLANMTCAIVNSFIGIILQVGELILTIVSGTLYGAAVTIAKTIASITIFNTVVPWALEAATNLGVTGTENSIDSFNNADAGSSLSAADYQRSYGGRAINDSEQLALVNASAEEDTQIARSKGWLYRNLDLTNTHSVASNFLTKVPNSTSSALAAVTNLPKTFATNLAAIIMNTRPSHAATVSSVNPYSFQFYGFTQAEIDKYDLLDNENYLTQTIPGTNVTRLSALGDPKDYVPPAIPGTIGDPNMDDLMHCFVNAPAVPNAFNVSGDPICQGVGVMTSPGGSTDHNPGKDVIMGIYAKAGIGGVGYDDDYLRYRLELLYSHLVRGMDCASTDQACAL